MSSYSEHSRLLEKPLSESSLSEIRREKDRLQKRAAYIEGMLEALEMEIEERELDVDG